MDRRPSRRELHFGGDLAQLPYRTGAAYAPVADKRNGLAVPFRINPINRVFQHRRRLNSCGNRISRGKTYSAAALCGPFLVADMVWVRGNEMRDLGGAVQMKAIDRILYQAIGVGDALMLAQMLDPGFH